MLKLTPNIMVCNVQETISFYQKHFQFEFVMGVTPENNIVMQNDKQEPLIYAQLQQGSITIMFQAQESLSEDIPYFADKKIGASISFYFEVEKIDQLYQQLKEQVTIIKELETTWYGMKEFYIADCNGYILGFASK